ncbi:bucky ball-like isoform X1 [Alosa sapidissima]|uniref:bucky ball-like isoform X1 n=2 Tax=Alosa sapidissima TaxID=34773 RepID=UPI001C08E6DD|nr:bucky ball-like isoform X1 [Alosa sapidissima]
MDEANQSSQSVASGQSQQRPVSHPRPFCYVQPPSQPYNSYQWHTNNPYNHYNFPGSGLPFGRTCFSPYSYMQYPGYVMPHAPVHLLDYRRMYDPHFNPAAYDTVRRHHHHSNVSRETTCSGAQTDPSDALNKLIECLDKLRASETSSERELDSGVISPTSGVCSLRDESKKEEPEEGNKQEPIRTQIPPASAGALFNNATTSACESNTSQRQREGWSMDSDGEPPLDTSSVREKHELEEEEDEEENDNDVHFHFCHTEKQVLTSDYPQDHPVCCGETKSSSFEGFHSHIDSSQGPEDGMIQGTEEINRVVPQSEARTATKESDMDDGDDLDLPYRIVHLPFGRVLSAGVIQKNLPVKAPSAVPPLSLGNPFYYSYCPPQLAHERLSVLSPSLDELSSRDEMFSTDLDDMDLFPGHVYTGGRRPELTAMEVQKPALTESGTMRLRKYTCATCGLRVPKRMVTAEAHISGAYCCDDQGDSDEGAVCEADKVESIKSCSRNIRKKAPTCRTLKSKCLQHRTKPSSRRLYCRAKTDHQGQSECKAWDYPMHKCCEELAAMTERSHRHEPREEQHRPCREKQWREGEGRHQDCREIGGGKGSVKPPKVQPLPQKQARRVQRRSVAKPQLCQNSKNQNPENDKEEEEDEGEEIELP